jgi:Dullard-like phosphatase family protein
MKNNKKMPNIAGILTKTNTLKVNQNKLSDKKNTKNSMTPRQTNLIKKKINGNSSTKIKVHMANNNEENINKNILVNQLKKNNGITKSKEKLNNETTKKKSTSTKKVLKVNKSYNTIAKNKNKKNDTNNYNSLINSLFTTHNDNKGYLTTTSTNNINSDINSTKREKKRSKSKTNTRPKNMESMNCNSNDNNKNNVIKNSTLAGSCTTTKKCIKKTKSNSNIKINLNNNFNNIIHQNINTINNKNNNNNTNKNEKIEVEKININVKQKLNSTGDNFNRGNRTNKNEELSNKKSMSNIRKNDTLDIKNKKRTKSSKKLTTKIISKKNMAGDDNANNKSSCTINNSKAKINMGRPSVNELLYNSINNTKSLQILSPIKQKQKKNINKNKNSINLLGSYNVKKNNTLNYKNNIGVNNHKNSNLLKKHSTILHNKKPKVTNQNKKNKKIINNNNNNNNIETNNTTGTLGTILNNKEEGNLSKATDNKLDKKSSKIFKSNINYNNNNITDSIETKINDNINESKKDVHNISSKKSLNEYIQIIEDESNDDNEHNEKNNIIEQNINNYYQMLDISSNTSSRHKKVLGMSKKNKSVSHMHISKKNDHEEGLKKCPLSKKSLDKPTLKDKLIIKFEDLLTFEEKLNDIITALLNKDNLNEGGASNECSEFMSFYFHSSLFGIFINFFKKNNQIIIHSGNILLLLSIIITYHLSINPKMLTNLLDDMKYIFSLLKINYLLLIKKIEIYYEDDFPLNYADILSHKLGQVKTTNCSNEIDIISKINKNCCNISERMKIILNYYQRNNDKNYNEFNGIFKNISTISEKNINSYFYNYLYINPFDFENNKINNINKINNNYNKMSGSSKNFPRMDSSISSISNTSIKGFDDNDSDNFYNDNMSYKTEKSDDFEREIRSVKSYKSTNYCGKLKSNNIGSTINCDNNFYYNIENNIYENDEDGTNAYEIMQMLKDYEINKVDAPFIVSPPKKKYTLVLDLDETLIHLRQKKDVINIKNDVNIKINNTSDYFSDNYDKNRNKYLLQFRVGLFSFLTILKPFYEIISFTSATREYADVIINEIEKSRKYFDHKFYREHTVIYKDTFVKDISRIGRDMSKIIIIDNNERNFVLNKENGIKIAPYYGDDDNNNNNIINNSINSENCGRFSIGGKKRSDNVLLELKKILVMIYKDNYDDLREALKDYDDLIKTKVSMNL